MRGRDSHHAKLDRTVRLLWMTFGPIVAILAIGAVFGPLGLG